MYPLYIYAKEDPSRILYIKQKRNERKKNGKYAMVNM